MQATRDSICFLGDWLPRRPLDLSAVASESQTVANLECAFWPETVASHKAHTAVADPAVLSVVAQTGPAALNLANNHALDAGEAALDQTVARLSDLCETQLFGLAQAPIAELERGPMRLAVIGCLERCRSRGRKIMPLEHVEDLIRDLRDHYDRVYVYPHWGKEGEYAGHPSPAQIRTARRWIDRGADGVLGHHPHSMHGLQEFRGKPIYYSIGNLDFQHPQGRDYPTTQTALAVTVKPDEAGDRWSHVLFAPEPVGPAPLAGETLEQQTRRLARLSQDLNGRWGPWRWARSVGPIYIPKSARSWRKRLLRTPCRTLPRFLVWNALPANVLLRLGCLAGSSRTGRT